MKPMGRGIVEHAMGAGSYALGVSQGMVTFLELQGLGSWTCRAAGIHVVAGVFSSFCDMCFVSKLRFVEVLRASCKRSRSYRLASQHDDNQTVITVSGFIVA
jgi:hypothetical protein